MYRFGYTVCEQETESVGREEDRRQEGKHDCRRWGWKNRVNEGKREATRRQDLNPIAAKRHMGIY